MNGLPLLQSLLGTKRISLLLVTTAILLPLSSGAQESRAPTGLAPSDHNIVLVFIDALRADHIGAYGYFRNTTPNLDRLAAEGIVFENHFTPYTVTIGSFISMITGLYPDSHGVRYISKDVLPEKIKTLAEILEENGYVTTWYGPENDPHLAPNVGFGRGFMNLGIFPVDLQEGWSLIEEFLDRSKGKKFFLNFHTYKVHDPYFPSAKYKEKIIPSPLKYSLPETVSEFEENTLEAVRDAIRTKGDKNAGKVFSTEMLADIASKGILDRKFPESKNGLMEYLKDRNVLHKWDLMRDREYKKTIQCNDAEIASYVKALYDAEILEFDTEITGPLVRKLHDLGIYDNTIIIVAADHGDEFCEHDGLGHGQTSYDEVIHVPLIIRFPWVKGGRRIRELTMTIDLMPTLLDILGIRYPEYIQGRSMKQAIRGQTESPARDAIMANYPTGLLTYRDKDWKLVVHPDGSRQLFNLRSDPAERTNVYMENVLFAAELETRMRQWFASLPSYGVDRPFSPNIDESTREKIKRTGYW